MARIKGTKSSAALIVAVVALVAALGGGAVAGVTISKLNNKEKQQVKRLSKKQAKKLDKKIELLPGPKGETGPQGPQGPVGAQGLPATKLWAVVKDDGTLVRGSSAAVSSSKISSLTGAYEVDFGENVENCAYIAVLGPGQAVIPPPGEIGTAQRVAKPSAVYVQTRSSGGSDTDQPFHLAVFC